MFYAWSHFQWQTFQVFCRHKSTGIDELCYCILGHGCPTGKIKYLKIFLASSQPPEGSGRRITCGQSHCECGVLSYNWRRRWGNLRTQNSFIPTVFVHLAPAEVLQGSRRRQIARVLLILNSYLKKMFRVLSEQIQVSQLEPHQQ